MNQDQKTEGGAAGLTFLFQKAIYQDSAQDFAADDISWNTSNLRRYLNLYNGWNGFSNNLRTSMVEVKKRSIKQSGSAWLIEEDDTSYVDTNDKLFILDVAEVFDASRGREQGVGDNRDECYLGANGLGSAAVRTLKGSWCRGTSGVNWGWIMNVDNIGWTARFDTPRPFFPAFCL